MRNVLLAGTVVLALTLAPGVASAKGHRKTAKSMDDKTFVLKAAKGGMAEIDLGKLAAEKGSNGDVKRFGQRMADDHSKANDELKSLAKSKNIALPTDVGTKEKAAHDRLAGLSGAAFDRAYMAYMLSDHEKDVAAFRTESRSGKDPDVKGWASKTLPTLEDHLKSAQATAKNVGAGTRK